MQPARQLILHVNSRVGTRNEGLREGAATRTWVALPGALLGTQTFCPGRHGAAAPPGAMQVQLRRIEAQFRPPLSVTRPHGVVFTGGGGATCQAPLRMPEPGSLTT